MERLPVGPAAPARGRPGCPPRGSAAAAGRRTRPASSFARTKEITMERLRVVPAALAALAILLALGSVLAPAASAAGRQEATLDRLPHDAGWHGRPVPQPPPHTAAHAAT